MRFPNFSVAGLALFLATAGAVAPAEATPIQTLSWSGTLGYGTDAGSPLFGTTAWAGLGGAAYSVTLSYDPTTLLNDTCGSSTSINYCNWTLGSATESITVNGITRTFTATSGNIGIGVGGGQINFTMGGVPQFGLNVTGGNLFAGLTNANFTTYSFTNLAVNGSFQASNLNGASLGGQISSLSATSDGGTTPVPEPLTLSLFGAGLIGIGLLLWRRKKSA
jgi:hypothetical protein